MLIIILMMMMMTMMMMKKMMTIMATDLASGKADGRYTGCTRCLLSGSALGTNLSLVSIIIIINIIIIMVVMVLINPADHLHSH